MTDCFLFVLPDTLPPFSTQWCPGFQPLQTTSFRSLPSGLLLGKSNWVNGTGGQRSNENINDNGVFLGLTILA